MIRLSKINKSYSVAGQPLHVLKDLDLVISPGEMVSIMGSSGSGKSTLLNLIGLLDTHDSGEYQLAGQRVWDLNERKAARLRNEIIGFVFQSFHLLPFKDAVENVALPLYYRGISRRKRNEMARETLDRVGLADRAHHLPNELSGGQQQRVAIARALVTEPKLVLADEPTGALDSTTSSEIMDLLTEVNGQGITVVIVTHEHDIAKLTRRTIHLSDGVVGDDVVHGVGSLT